MSTELNANRTDTWSGYTLEELQYVRTKAMLRKELQEDKLRLKALELLAEDAMPSGIVGTVSKGFFGRMSVVDYLLLGFKLSKNLKNVWNFCRKKKII